MEIPRRTLWGAARYYVRMKRIRHHLSLLTVLGSLLALGMLLVAGGTVQDAVMPQVATVQVLYAVAPVVTAQSMIIVDAQTGTSLFEKRADTVHPIASITKLFTAAVWWQQADLYATSTITWSDVATDGRAGRLRAGQQYQNRELLFPLLLESSNDAAATMARVAPFPLVARMNELAAVLGATQTTLVDTSGLKDGNVSTARDLARVFRGLQRTEPHILDVTQLPLYLNHVNAWMNNNPFIEDPAYRGGKHGYTYTANRTVVAAFAESLTGGTREIVYVLLGSDDLEADMRAARAFVHANVSLQ